MLLDSPSSCTYTRKTLLDNRHGTVSLGVANDAVAARVRPHFHDAVGFPDCIRPCSFRPALDNEGGKEGEEFASWGMLTSGWC
jgi:hypothetical protein